MIYKKASAFIIACYLATTISVGQVVINEGTNRNYSSIADENGEYPDWIEIYNPGSSAVSLFNYSLTDNPGNPVKWVFPNIEIQSGEFRTVFCSGKDRKPVSGFVLVQNTGTFTPGTGWNTHNFSTPFYWDGVSNILINTCSFSSAGYTSNSVFKQTETSYWSTSFAFMDGSPAACQATSGSRVKQRPNMKLNGHVIGNGTITNSPYDYPAPYGNWYWGARHQMLIPASELTSAGLSAGNINSLSFNVVSTSSTTVYDYIEIHMRLVSYNELPTDFDAVDTNNYLHTNFKIDRDGETVYLFSPSGTQLSQLFVNVADIDNSTGSHPDASPDVYLFQQATPSASNNASPTYTDYLLPPVFSVPSGFYESPFSVSVTDPNTGPSAVRYTLDGSDPTTTSSLYTGTPISIADSLVLRARAFSSDFLPSPNVAATYLLNVDHLTPVLSVITDYSNLYGPTGIFDNWWYDWEKTAYVEYFDSTKNLIFSQRTGMQIDGGWGGSRANPQHSFRLELNDPVLGDGSISYPLIPDKPGRTKYSQFYLRNGSNQYLVLPYKDACQVRMMSKKTHNYYSAWRPVSVYINGNYFGLYELREKFDDEFFETFDGADPGQTDILTLSAWYNFVLRAVEGSVEPFWDATEALQQLDPADTSFWTQADQYFDMEAYNDYIIGESWMGNTDWPWNNIKIYRSDATGFRWRFCIIDQELAMLPNGSTDCFYDHIAYMMTYDQSNPYLSTWQKGMQNERFRNYFINRFADVMNTAYLSDSLLNVELDIFNQTVHEMPKEYRRWGDPNNILGQMMDFRNNHFTFQDQLSLRSEQVRTHILNNFGLPNLVDVTLDIQPEDAGTIQISTVTPEIYPWNGIYFNGVPVKIEATAKTGYSFSHWEPNGLITDTLNPVFLDTLTATNLTFRAVYEPWAVDIDNKDHRSSLTLWPNPASTTVTLKSGKYFTRGSEYHVVDLNGRTVSEGTLPEGQGIAPIGISNLRPAVYILLVTRPGVEDEHLRFVKIN
jgi:hypothetical protein